MQQLVTDLPPSQPSNESMMIVDMCPGEDLFNVIVDFEILISYKASHFSEEFIRPHSREICENLADIRGVKVVILID